MPAKKKSRRAQRPTAEMRRLAEDNADLLAERARLRKELAEARRGREAWCHKAVECETLKERAEEALRDLLAGIVTPRPSEPRCLGCDNSGFIHTCDRFLRGAAVPVHTPQAPPTTTLGEPGDASPTRFSREFRP